jgi:hypothetical protein
MKDYSKLLPQDLRGRAYQAMNLELAWGKDDALEVIEILSAHQIAILGGEVWIPTTPGPTLPPPNLYAWDTQPKTGNECWTEYAGRTKECAKEFIGPFYWKLGEEARYHLAPFFNLSVCDEAEYFLLLGDLDMLKEEEFRDDEE